LHETFGGGETWGCQKKHLGGGGVGRGDIPKTRVVWHCIINLLSSKDSRIAKKRKEKKRKDLYYLF
jgi:hypothetical protein